ncbi:MAG: hypothetical protein EOO73_20475 [Myxococcales bacterium]|nr:MAG: hypothetical protein EOO73_20475 [Myxococcales bacterium]
MLDRQLSVLLLAVLLHHFFLLLRACPLLITALHGPAVLASLARGRSSPKRRAFARTWGS